VLDPELVEPLLHGLDVLGLPDLERDVVRPRATLIEAAARLVLV
jgi:hypothetical protein